MEGAVEHIDRSHRTFQSCPITSNLTEVENVSIIELGSTLQEERVSPLYIELNFEVHQPECIFELSCASVCPRLLPSKHWDPGSVRSVSQVQSDWQMP